MTEGPYKLPDGWRWVRLGEVCQINPRRPRLNIDPTEEGTFVPMSAVDADLGVISLPETRPFSVVKTGYKPFEENDVLFAKITPCMENGKSAVARGLLKNIGFGSTEFHVLRPSSLVLSEWIWLYVRKKDFRESARAAFRGGVGQQRVPAEFLQEACVPLPPFNEQQRIVARVEALMDQVREARRLRKEAREDAERFWQATLAEVFPRPGTDLSSGWRWVKLGEVFVLRNGKFIRKSRLGNSGDIRVYGSNGLIGYTRGVEPIIHTNTIVIGRVGTCGAVNIALAPSWVSDNAMYVCEWLTDCDLSYIALALRHSNLGAFPKQGAQPSISQAEVYQKSIPLPPLEEQRRIVARIEEVEEKVKSLKEGQAQVEAELQRLEQSILNAAFRGEL